MLVGTDCHVRQLCTEHRERDEYTRAQTHTQTNCNWVYKLTSLLTNLQPV